MVSFVQDVISWLSIQVINIEILGHEGKKNVGGKRLTGHDK
jgi:hypothetical protein